MIALGRSDDLPPRQRPERSLLRFLSNRFLAVEDALGVLKPYDARLMRAIRSACGSTTLQTMMKNARDLWNPRKVRIGASCNFGEDLEVVAPAESLQP